jgi:phosphoglycolate phosphatase
LLRQNHRLQCQWQNNPGFNISLQFVKVVIFDFDGTIADSFDAVLKIVNQMAIEFGFEPLNPAEVKRLRNLSSREIVRQSKVSMLRLPILLRRLKTELNREIGQLQPIEGMPEALATLKQRGDRLGIVTSNSRENVEAFLKAQNLDDLFDFIYSGMTIFGKGKILKRILRENHLNGGAVFYVGDETRDIEAAQKTGIQVVAVSWGFNSKQALLEQMPDFLIDQAHELVKAIHEE